jgi:hypothetical protein
LIPPARTTGSRLHRHWSASKKKWYQKRCRPADQGEQIDTKTRENVFNNPNYQTQVVDNHDEQNSRIAMEKMISQSISKERRKELNLYKRYAQDPEFKRAFDSSIMRLLTQTSDSRLQSELLG